MKKSVFWISLAVMSFSVLGMNSNNILRENEQQDTSAHQINSDFQLFDFPSQGSNTMIDQNYSSKMPENLVLPQTNLNLQPYSSLNPLPDQNSLTDLNFPSYSASTSTPSQDSLFNMQMKFMQWACQEITQRDQKIKQLEQIILQQNLQMQILKSSNPSIENPGSSSENQQDSSTLFNQFIQLPEMVDNNSPYPEISKEIQDDQVFKENSNNEQSFKRFLSMSSDLKSEQMENYNKLMIELNESKKLVQEHQEKIEIFEKQKADYEKNIGDLSAKLKEITIETEELKKQQTINLNKIEFQKKQLEYANNQAKSLGEQLGKKNKEIKVLKQKMSILCKDSQEQIQKLQDEIKGKEKEQAKTLNDAINKAFNEINKAKQAEKSRQDQLKKANDEKKYLEEQLERKDIEIESQKKRLEEKGQEIEVYKQKETESSKTIQAQSDKINILEQSQKQQDQETENLRQQIKSQNDQLKKQSEEKESLEKTNLALEQELNRKRKRPDFESELGRPNQKYYSKVPSEEYNKFFEALKESNTNKLRDLVRNYPQLVVKRNHRGWTPIMRIICDEKINEKDKYATIEDCLKANEIIKGMSNKKTKFWKEMINRQEVSGGSSALTMAVIQGNFAIVNLLLEYGADPNIQDNDGWTPLMRAVKIRNKEIVRVLLKHKADPNKQCRGSEVAALHIAVTHKDIDIIELLLNYKHKLNVNVNIKDSGGWTPLMKAVEKKDKKIAEILLEHGVKINERERKGNTALHQAISQENIEMVKLLLKYEADPNIQNNEGWSPLILSAEYGLPNIMKELIIYRADPYLETSLGNNTLRTAIFSKKASKEAKMEMIRMIIEADPRIITYKNFEGFSALSTAEHFRLKEIKDLLLKHKEEWEFLIDKDRKKDCVSTVGCV